MIDLSQSTLIRLLVSAFLLGISLGLLYEIIRFVKILMGVKYGNSPQCARSGRVKSAFLFTVTLIFDVAFWLIFAASSLLLTYNVSGGVFRGMVYIAMLSGGAIYYLTLGRLLLCLSIKLDKIIKATAWRIIKILLIPIRAIFSLLIRIYHLTFGKVIGKIICVVKKRIAARSNAGDAQALPQGKDEEKETDGSEYRYKREGRIRFTGHRADR